MERSVITEGTGQRTVVRGHKRRRERTGILTRRTCTSSYCHVPSITKVLIGSWFLSILKHLFMK